MELLQAVCASIGIILVGIAAVMAVFFCLRGGRSDSAELSEAQLDSLSDELANHAIGLVTFKYCHLVCDQITEIEDNLREDLRRAMRHALLQKHDITLMRSGDLVRRIADVVGTFYIKNIKSPECERCEERSEIFREKTKKIIYEILKQDAQIAA